MKVRMTCQEFYECMSDEGYTLFELGHLFRAVCEMSSRVRRWTIRWLLGMGLPKDSIEGVTVPFLVSEGYKPMNAFIIMDWLEKDPEAAKYSLVRHTRELEMNEETAAELRAAAIAEGLLSEEKANEEQEGSESAIVCENI